MTAAYRLRAGDVGPVQQSAVSCGSACLTVARMLVDPVFARWMTLGDPRLPGLPAAGSESERFAAYERLVMRRTNGVFRSGCCPNVPWPRSLGTPPWGARRELERHGSREGTRYDVVRLPREDRGGLVAAYDRLVAVVAEGEPGLLYVGNARLPRHVTLVLPGDGDRTLDVYDPATGSVRHLRRDVFAAGRLSLGGWDVPWFTVQPTGLRRAYGFGFSTGMRSTSREPSVSPSS